MPNALLSLIVLLLSGTVVEAFSPLQDHVEQLCSTYTACLDQYHVATQSVTAGLFSGLGDVLAQSLDSTKPYSKKRTGIYILKGLGGGIVWNYWYQMADPVSLRITQSLPLLHSAVSSSSSVSVDPSTVEHMVRVAVCIVLEQCLVCPIVYTAWDIPFPALLSGSPMRQLPAQISSKLMPLLAANAVLWTPINIVTYNLPVQYRVLFASCADLVWQVINSQITSQDIEVTLDKTSTASTVTTTTTTAPLQRVVVAAASKEQPVS